MKWKTAISTKKDNEVFVRGRALAELVAEKTFSEAAFLLLKGVLSNENERKLFDAILVSCVEHGIEPPSAFVPRVSVSVGNPMNAALAAGMLAIGEHHGGAIEKAAFLFQQEKSAVEIVSEVVAAGERFPGFGHKVYKDKDPRAELLLEKAESLGFSGAFAKKARECGEELENQTGKHFPLNIDGVIAALMLELGFDWRLGKAIFALGRLPGMIAHSHEEMVNEKPYRRLEEGDVEYIGEPL